MSLFSKIQLTEMSLCCYKLKHFMYFIHYSNLEFDCGNFVAEYSSETQNQWH